MTPEFQYLMNLVGNGAQGKIPASPPDGLNWELLFRLAHEQTVAALTSFTLKKNPDTQCPEQIKNTAIASMRGSAINNYMRKERIIALLKLFEENGIHAVLLKGYAVADEYCSPECRISADTDIWVAPDDEERGCELLRSQGFMVEPRWKNGHHAVCHHPVMGCVELHVILYDEIVEEVWFGKMDGNEFVQEPHEQVISENVAFYTLGKTDHLLFLALHMIKHFIISGMSLRMMLDVAMFYRNHANEIDVARFWDTLRSLRYERCTQTILWAMIQYAGFTKNDFSGLCVEMPEGIGVVLDDLEAGGTMGIKDKQNREDGWNAYNRELLMKQKSKAAYIMYMLKWQSSGLLKSLFPGKEGIARRYPYVNIKPWLIPYAWVHRLVFRGFRRLKRGEVISHINTDESKLAESGKLRLEMFRSLGMI